MKQKINLSLMTLSVLAIFVTMFCLTSVYYNLFQEQVRKDLKIEARMLSETGISNLFGSLLSASLISTDLTVETVEKEADLVKKFYEYEIRQLNYPVLLTADDGSAIPYVTADHEKALAAFFSYR